MGGNSDKRDTKCGEKGKCKGKSKKHCDDTCTETETEPCETEPSLPPVVCDSYSCAEIYQKYSDAVVDITSELILTKKHDSLVHIAPVLIEEEVEGVEETHVNITSAGTYSTDNDFISTAGNNINGTHTPLISAPLDANSETTITQTIATTFTSGPLNGHTFSILYTFNYNTEGDLLSIDYLLAPVIISTPATLGSPAVVVPEQRPVTHTFKSTGTCINDGLILVPSHVVLASPAMMMSHPSEVGPPTNNFRYPHMLADTRTYTDPSPTFTGPAASHPEVLVQMSRILVTMHNVNGCGSDIIYDAEVVLVDGSGGYSLIRINPKSEWNRCLPCIKDHPCLCFGESRKLNRCDPIHVLGNSTGPSKTKGHRGIASGKVSNYRASDHKHGILGELVTTDVTTHGGIGSPMINQYGQLVGMVVSSQPTSGLSEYFMRGGVKSAMCYKKEKYQKHIEYVSDHKLGSGGYYRYVKGFLGMNCQIACPSDYTTYVSNLVTGERSPLFNLARNGLTQYPKGDKCDGGYLVNAVAGNSNDFVNKFHVVGTASPVSGQFGSNFGVPILNGPSQTHPGADKQSNFYDRVSLGSIIKMIGDCPAGDDEGHITLALALSARFPGERIKLSILSPNVDSPPGMVAVADAGHLEMCNDVSGAVMDTPAVYDSFWYHYEEVCKQAEIPLNEAYLNFAAV